MRTDKERNPSVLEKAFRVMVTVGFACTFAASVGAQTAVEVIKDGKKFFQIDGELFPALEALGPPPIPRDNPQRVDEDGWPLKDDPKVRLGELLFFEPALSGDGSVSCQTCHVQGAGWALNSAISRSYPGQSHWRNSQSVVNAAYMSKLFWDGHKESLETQAPSAAKGLAGNGKAPMMAARLQMIPEYVAMFKEAFGSIRNPTKDAWRAISAFERTLTSTIHPLTNIFAGMRKRLMKSKSGGLICLTVKHAASCVTTDLWHRMKSSTILACRGNRCSPKYQRTRSASDLKPIQRECRKKYSERSNPIWGFTSSPITKRTWGNFEPSH